MPPPRIQKNIAQHVKPARDGMDAKHLSNIRLCPCLACGREPAGHATIQAHHLLRTEERGLSRKSSDRWAIPLDHECHRALHAAGDEEAFLAGRGVDGRAVARVLWAVRGDLEAMRRIVFRARQEANRKIAELDRLLGGLK